MIVVIGGTGFIGSRVVAKLSEDGHQAVAASRETGVNTLTGEGLADALAGAAVLVDVSNVQGLQGAALLEFFETSTRNLLAAAVPGVRHYVALSVVGCDGLPDSGYLRAKVVQEELIKHATVPYTIIRSTQFFEFIKAIAEANADGDTIRLTPARLQPIAADDLATAIADTAAGKPVNGTIEVAGPDALPLDEMARRVLATDGDRRTVTSDPRARYFGAELDDHSLTPGAEARLGSMRLEEWLTARVAQR